MDGVALDRSENALTILAENLPGWALTWNPNLGCWDVRNPEGFVRASDRSPFEAVVQVLERMRLQIIPHPLVA